jgi:hypothetical protein
VVVHVFLPATSERGAVSFSEVDFDVLKNLVSYRYLEAVK